MADHTSETRTQRVRRWVVAKGPLWFVVITAPIGWYLMLPSRADIIAARRVCDSAVSELVNARDPISLDRAEFVIKREDCGMARRMDQLLNPQPQ